ncbi:PucR family transcriptional regulator [Kutzneria albida]|uniref:Uncharacterized protein n=1 Tax=Kutzneria albida DSM 43870 TaxID=1449976 RepID=W5WEQ7_9PSEU|nr:helix-turn-helix domain-containing protein [Kutzneria albida]AHH99678.1 hypothetical protein KALB_6318 [Kutzneria albida DSM 43870]
MRAELGIDGRSDSARLWAALPEDLADRFRPLVEVLAEEVLREVVAAVPAYHGATLARAVHSAITYCLDAVHGSPSQGWAAQVRELGKLEYSAGRTLDCLQTAYRVGGRVAWRYVAAWGRGEGLPVPVFRLAAEAIFAYVDELSVLSVEGYTSAQAQAVGQVERWRRRLLELLLSEPPASRQAIDELAVLARWKLPELVTVVAVEPRTDQPPTSPELHEDVLVDLEGDRPRLLTGDPELHLRELGEQLTGRRACVGMAVPPERAHTSWRLANRAMALASRGVLPDRQVIWCRDHIAALWLLADEFLMNRLIQRALLPLAGLTHKQRSRMVDTLLVWLDTRGSAQEIATRLRIHPQTVRYRMRQAEQLFGARLADPAARLELEIALQSQRLLWGRR